MVTFIIYNETDGENFDRTLNSIKSNFKESVIVMIKKELEVLDALLLSNTTYTMILKAGDIINKCLTTDYYDVTVPGLDESYNWDKLGLRGILLGQDIINNIKEDSEFKTIKEFIRWIQGTYNILYSDYIEVTFIGE